MSISQEQVQEVLKKHKSLTAEQIAEKLKIELTQENRKRTLFTVRKLARKVVDKEEGGDRTEFNEEKKLLYTLK